METVKKGKYRRLTAARMKAPAVLGRLFPKGREDCGDHEWQLVEPGTWQCVHCVPGVTHENPWTPIEQLTISIAALSTIFDHARGRGGFAEWEVPAIRRLSLEIEPAVHAIATRDPDPLVRDQAIVVGDSVARTLDEIEKQALA
jgi:hypothetical protein